MKTIVRPSFFAFFLTPASAPASTAESCLRPAPGLVPWAADNSIPAAAESAMHGRRDSESHTLSRSSGQHAPTSTDHSRIPELAALASGRVRCAADLPAAGVLCVLLVQPFSAPEVHRLRVASPSDRLIVDEPGHDEPPPQDVRPDAIVRPPQGGAVPTPRSPGEPLLD